MRSFASTTMQHARRFFAGDATYIVPPTGAKGFNLAVSEICILSNALQAFSRQIRTDLLDAYSATALRCIWCAEHFSYWMTRLMHRLDASPFEQHLQVADLEYLTSSRQAALVMAENYEGISAA